MISRALQVLIEQEQELERERSEIRALLDERWRRASKPAAESLDGEQLMAELESEIDNLTRRPPHGVTTTGSSMKLARPGA